jgi:hypothetical protein
VPTIRLLVSVGGDVGGHDSPAAGQQIDVTDDVARAWADGVRAVTVEAPKPKAKAKGKAKKAGGSADAG